MIKGIEFQLISNLAFKEMSVHLYGYDPNNLNTSCESMFVSLYVKYLPIFTSPLLKEGIVQGGK